MINTILKILEGWIQQQLIGYYKEVLPCANDLEFKPGRANGGLGCFYKNVMIFYIEEHQYLYEVINIKEHCVHYEKKILEIELSGR